MCSSERAGVGILVTSKVVGWWIKGQSQTTNIFIWPKQYFKKRILVANIEKLKDFT